MPAQHCFLGWFAAASLDSLQAATSAAAPRAASRERDTRKVQTLRPQVTGGANGRQQRLFAPPVTSVATSNTVFARYFRGTFEVLGVRLHHMRFRLPIRGYAALPEYRVWWKHYICSASFAEPNKPCAGGGGDSRGHVQRAMEHAIELWDTTSRANYLSGR